MKKLLKYTLYTILFLIIWHLQMAVVLYLTIVLYGELRPNSLIAIGGIITLFLSYKLVKKINISKLFSRTKKDKKLEGETIITITEKKPSMKKKLLSFLKKYYKIISLVIILVSVGVTTFLFSDDLIPKSINPPDPFDWYDYNHPTAGRSEVIKSNDSLYYLRRDMSLYTGRIVSGDSYNKFYQGTFLNGKKHGVEGYYVRNGKFKYLSYYKNGLKHGKWETWNLEERRENGYGANSNNRHTIAQLTSRVFYENGLKQGEWKKWDYDGNLIKHWIMKDDIPIEKIVN